MSEEYQNAMVPMPLNFPLVLPHFGHAPQQPQPGPRPEDYVPPRVTLAMQFLSSLSAKTRAEAVKYGPVGIHCEGAGSGDVSTGGVEVVKGQELAQPERTAQAAACMLLTDYFNGNLPETKLEKRAERRGRRGKRKVVRGSVITCQTCNGNPHLRLTCQTCEGSGKVMIECTPVR